MMGFSSSPRSRVASLLLLCLSMLLLCRAQDETPKLYIVYLGHVKHGHPDDVVASHHDMLATLLGSKEESAASVVYNYKHGFSGFAAMLTPEQAKKLAEFPEVISVERSKKHTTATTRSWDFLGLNYHTPASGQVHGTNYGEEACGQKMNYGEDVIIGVIDSVVGFWDHEGDEELQEERRIIRSPMAKIEPARTVTGKEVLAPKVASFSSRGPSPDYPDIIKPNIAAPGANILAAQQDSYVFMSGTSMAAPHVSGVVALLKALHPDWSPAAIKSAIITSARVTDERGMPILAEGLPRKIADPFDYGGGNINPLGAADPGLVYDIDPRDYTKFFACTIVRRTNVSCNATTLPAYHLNLPSIAVPDLRRPVNMSRTVMNVGEVDAMYEVMVESPVGVKMEIEPSVLVFDAVNRTRTFTVKLSPVWKLQGDYTFSSITWHSDRKAVRIPVAARITVQDFYVDVA